MRQWCAGLAVNAPTFTELSGQSAAPVVELHRAFLDMLLFRAGFRLQRSRDSSVSELVAIVELVQASASRPLDPGYQHDPWKRLEPTLAYLRGMTEG